MASLDLRLYNEIEQHLGELLEQHAAELVTGKSTDWADYRFRTGYMKGLRDALVATREAQARVLGVEDKDK